MYWWQVNKKGRDQALNNAIALSQRYVDVIYSSEVLRAVETAEIIGGYLGIHDNIKHDGRLNERNPGDMLGSSRKSHW